MSSRDEVPVSDIRAEGRHRQDMGDLGELCRSIEKIGLIHPVAVTPDLRLIAGQRRIEAYRRLGRDSIPVTIVEGLTDATALLTAERDENTSRKGMLPSELLALGDALEELERPKARERMAEAGRSAAPGRPVGKVAASTGTFLGSDGGEGKPSHLDRSSRTANIVGPAIGMSGSKYERLKRIGKRAKEGDDLAKEVMGALDRGEMTVTAGYKLMQKNPSGGKSSLKEQDPPKRLPEAERVEQIRTLTAQAHNVHQIAAKIGVDHHYVLLLARRHNIVLCDESSRGRIRPNLTRILTETVIGLEGLGLGVKLLNGRLGEIDPVIVEESAAYLSAALRPLNKLVKQLREATSGQ